MQVGSLLVELLGFLMVAQDVVGHSKVLKHCGLLCRLSTHRQGLQEGLYCQREELKLEVTHAQIIVERPWRGQSPVVK